MSRKEDLEADIRDAYGLLREYEQRRQFEDDPRAKRRIAHTVDEQWKLIEGYLNEYSSLCRALQVEPPSDIVQIALTLNINLMITISPPPTSSNLGSEQVRGNRWAVLIGANYYEDANYYGSLRYCVKDARAIGQQLMRGGFDSPRVRLLADDTQEAPTRENILSALRSVAQATEPDDLLLFYYSGHGDGEKEESYLVSRNGRRVNLEDTAIPVSRIRQIIEEAPARAKVIILDACYSGANAGGTGPQTMTVNYIHHVVSQAGVLAILASCAQNQLSFEWSEQERSVFTHFLLEALEGHGDSDKKGYITVRDTSRYVTSHVKLWASQHNILQTPIFEAKLTQDIILTMNITEGAV